MKKRKRNFLETKRNIFKNRTKRKKKIKGQEKNNVFQSLVTIQRERTL
jgi:hypothetical protein